MPVNISFPHPVNADGGVSELIGAILMITVVIAAVAIVSIFLLSQTTPQNIPNVNFMTGTDNSNNLYLFHNGGDSLSKGCFSVIVDNNVRNDYTISDGSNEWSLGKNLILTGVSSSSPHSISIVYNTGSGGPVVIRSGNSSIMVPATPRVNPDVISASTYPPIVSVPQLMENITNKSINYYRENGSYIASGFIKFNITQINSTLFIKPDTVSLNIGDVVTITPAQSSLTTSPSFRIFGVGDQIWEMNAEKVDLSITNRTPSLSYTGILLNHSWITGYKDFQSTLTLSTVTGNSYYTEFAVNNYPSYAQSQTFSSQIINGTRSNTLIQVSNVRPTTVGLFLLVYDSNRNSTYFVGNGSYTITGST